MSLTAAELKRIENLEETVLQLSYLVKDGGSKNQLNRLNVLAQKQVDMLVPRVEALETDMDTLLALARKFQ
jgi:uncharacterized protein (UPF0335 family)